MINEVCSIDTTCIRCSYIQRVFSSLVSSFSTWYQSLIRNYLFGFALFLGFWWIFHLFLWMFWETQLNLKSLYWMSWIFINLDINFQSYASLVCGMSLNSVANRSNQIVDIDTIIHALNYTNTTYTSVVTISSNLHPLYLHYNDKSCMILISKKLERYDRSEL